MECLQYGIGEWSVYSSEERVLNLVINGMPSIRTPNRELKEEFREVLNLVINGMPSIQK